MDMPVERENFRRKLGAADDAKLNAAADFAARLLAGPGGKSVARIILFGSVAGGVARPDSDVDVMVFSNAPRHLRVTFAAEAAWEATMNSGELVAPLTYHVDRLFRRSPYVVHDTLNRGREIFAMDEHTLRRIEAASLLRKAERHLAQAQAVIHSEAYELAVVGAFTASEIAVRALLLLRPGLELPHTHGGTTQMFAREYIKTGMVPRDWGRRLDEILQFRTSALYDAEVMTSPLEAQAAVALARELTDYLVARLEESESGNRD